MLKRLATQESVPPWGYLSALGTFIVMFLGIVIGSSAITLIFSDNNPAILLAGWGIGMVITIFYVFTTHRKSSDDSEALRFGITRDFGANSRQTVCGRRLG